MGTRSLTIVKDENEKEIGVMYRQYDGYLEGHGLELAEKFGDFKIVNGIMVGADTSKMANGMGCLFAQIIAYFKDGIGGVYLYPPLTRDVWEEFTYIISLREGELNLTVSTNVVLYDGLFSEFEPWLIEKGWIE